MNLAPNEPRADMFLTLWDGPPNLSIVKMWTEEFRSWMGDS